METPESRYSVIRVRDKYTGPYRKAPYINFQKEDFLSEVVFKRALRKKIKLWQSGTYMLKMSNGGIFARFDVCDGTLEKIYKESPVTGRLYPLAELFRK